MSRNRPQIHTPLLCRNLVLRILLMSTLAAIPIGILVEGAEPQFKSAGASAWIGSTVFPLLIIIHHTLRLWPRRFWLVICELLASLVEVAATGFFFASSLPLLIKTIVSGEKPPTNLPLSMLYGATLLVAAVSCFIALLFLLFDIFNDRGKSMRQAYDFSAGLCQPGSQWSFICGKFVTRKRFSTDNIFIHCVRGGLAILCLPLMAALVIYAIILQPVESSGRQGIKISKMTVPNGDLDLALQQLTKTLPSDVPHIQAVLRDMSVSPSDQHPTISVGIQDIYNGLTVPTNNCRNDTGTGTVLTYCPFLSIPTQSHSIVDILFTIHFPDGAGDFRFYLGMTNSTDDILAEAEPIGINPGSNLHGWSSISVKERFSGQNTTGVGLLLQYRLFALINIGALSPDLSTSLPRDSSTATIRVTVMSQQNVELEQEYLEGSVLSGIAFVGGIWTLLNGTFAAVFGTTVLLVLFGIKPLSIYGLVHLFRREKGSLVDGGFVLSPEERDRIVGILREHLLDVEGTEGDRTSSSLYSPMSALPRFGRSYSEVGVQK